MSERNLEYNGTFSANGILFSETVRLKSILAGENVDENLALEVRENKLLQINSEATRGRVIREIRKRNKYAPAGFWNEFAQCPEEEQRLLFFYLCLKTYRILFDLHFKVTVRRFHVDATLPDNFQYKMAVDELASENEVAAGWSETTLVKTFSNYRRLLRVAGLLAGEKLQKPNVNPDFWEQFRKVKEFWFMEACFQTVN
jgi:hypothetical protein